MSTVFPISSWFMNVLLLPRWLSIGEDSRCNIELATKSMSQEQMTRVEQLCNELISQGVPMTPRWCGSDSLEMEQV